jgi:hypothetical protein
MESTPLASREPPALPAASHAPAGRLEDFDVDVEVVGAAEEPSSTWPANAPDHASAEEALLAGMDRTPPPFPAFGAVAIQVADALSELEVKALARAPLQIDGGPIRRAAAMRLRVGVAFATAPPRGASSDPAAVAALLAEIDDLLSEVNALAVDAPPELAPALSACRNALVKEAIDFSETAQRYVAVDAPFAQEAPVARPRVMPSVRVLSDSRVSRDERKGGRRSRNMVIALAISAALVAAYQVWNRISENAPSSPLPALAGVPANAIGLEAADGSSRIVRVKPGEQLDPGVLRKFMEDERLKGREVVEASPGLYVSRPAERVPTKESSP